MHFDFFYLWDACINRSQDLNAFYFFMDHVHQRSQGDLDALWSFSQLFATRAPRC